MGHVDLLSGVADGGRDRYAFLSDLLTNNRFWRSTGTLNSSVASRYASR
jgi:hypothetical protein